MRLKPFDLGIALALLALASANVRAQVAPPPTSGDIMRETAPPAPPLPRAEPPLPTIAPAPAGPMTALPGGGQRVHVRKIDIAGNRVIATSELEPLVAADAGKDLTLAEMEAIAERITLYYRSHGYFVARAYVPAQDLTDGDLSLRVVEGNYGNFVLENKSLVRDDIVQGLLDDIKDRDIVSLDTLERAMLIINDTPGVRVVRADVMPGQRVGTSDFAIGTESTPRFDGFVLADNYGSRYTGKDRISFNANWNSPSGRGDRLSLSGLASTNSNLLSGRLDYSALVASNGTRVEGALSRTTYSLGSTYAALDAQGHADSIEVDLSTPYKRTRNIAVALGGGFAHRILRDEIGSTSTVTDKHSDSLTLRAALSSEGRVGGSEGSAQASAALSLGHLGFDDAADAALDAAGARTQGTWLKLNLDGSRVSSLAAGFSLTTFAHAQAVLNNHNLDGSERLTVSGFGGVSAYPIGELAGDDALVARAEMAHALANAGSVRFSGNVFTSWGCARAAHPINAAGQMRDLADAGIGLDLAIHQGLVRIAVAHRLQGGAPQSEPASPNKVLVQAGFSF